jgi:DNA-binding CsgD family transcriptional regulator
LLAWVGGFSDEEPGDDARRLLNSLVPALRRRLVLERVLARGPLFEAALQASLEHVPRAAYVLSDAGGVLLANSAGIAELDRSPVQLRAALAATQSPGDPSGFSVTPIHAYGRAPIHLVVAAPRGGIEDRVAPFARKLGLTPRQKQVLAALAIGEANKTIAARLQCAERTIELHISAILEKAGVDSRAALIARFFLG